MNNIVTTSPLASARPPASGSQPVRAKEIVCVRQCVSERETERGSERERERWRAGDKERSRERERQVRQGVHNPKNVIDQYSLDETCRKGLQQGLHRGVLHLKVRLGVSTMALFIWKSGQGFHQGVCLKAGTLTQPHIPNRSYEWAQIR